MKTIIVDDEPIMLRSFVRLSGGIEELNIIGQFEDAREALDFAAGHEIELAVLDIAMPFMNGIELAEKLKMIHPHILVVFISAFEDYIRESNRIGADYYIVKPYKKEILQNMAERMAALNMRFRKSIRIQTFGRFLVLKEGQPVALTGKAKEILALVVTRRGKEISNEEIYSVLWENRPYSNIEMKVYYNALKRLKDALGTAGIPELLISTGRGQLLNTEIADCDYYDWQDHNSGSDEKFQGEFMSEYSWGEAILADMLRRELTV